MTATPSSAKTFWSLVESLPPDTDWEILRQTLDARLLAGPALTTPERRLLAGLRLREEFLHSPLYRKLDTKGPQWWIALIGSRGALMAEPLTR